MKHGFYGHRLPEGAIPTTEYIGYTKWHMLAGRLLDYETAILFLAGTRDVSTNALLDDVREHMTVFPSTPEYEANWEIIEFRWGEKHDYEWSQMQAITAWHTPIQIARLLGWPLIPRSLDWVPVHRVVSAADLYARGLSPRCRDK